MRSPWKGGSSSLRWRMCSAPSSSSTERSPSTGPEHRVGLAGAQLVGRAAEHLLHEVGVEDHHEARVEQRPEGDDVAVLAPVAVDPPDRHEDEAHRLHPARQAAGRAGAARRWWRPSPGFSQLPPILARARWRPVSRQSALVWRPRAPALGRRAAQSPDPPAREHPARARSTSSCSARPAIQVRRVRDRRRDARRPLTSRPVPSTGSPIL